MSKTGKMCYNISVCKSRRQTRVRFVCGDMDSGGRARRHAGRPRNDEETARAPCFRRAWTEKVEKYI